jgi:putative SOS response-associated peptidase YedK
VILEPSTWGDWLDLSADPAPLLKAGPARTIRVEQALEPVATK